MRGDTNIRQSRRQEQRVRVQCGLGNLARVTRMFTTTERYDTP